VLSNLYPTQSSIPSHNVYFESLQASCTIPAADGASITNGRNIVDFVTRARIERAAGGV
jgi:hypothetical protein